METISRYLHWQIIIRKKSQDRKQSVQAYRLQYIQ